MAAIAAAINSYLIEEQESMGKEAPRPVPRIPVTNLWGLAGRDEIMRTRARWHTYLQRKS